MFRLLWDVLFPPYCVNCGKFDSYVCQRCYDNLFWYEFPVQIDINRPTLSKLFATTVYSHTGEKLIKALKYRLATDVVDTIVDLMELGVKRPDVDYLTCVPLHTQKERVRGFNQAELIAKRLSQVWGIPYLTVLTRPKATLPQSQFDRGERLLNLKGAFEFLPNNISGKNIAIIDDVSTTGATLNECAKVLKRHHAGEIIGIVFAHG